MTPIAERIPSMSDVDLASLRTNAVHLSEHGSASQMTAASDALPIIDRELARRAALPKPPRTPASKKVAPAIGHQTALPKTS